MLLLIVGLVLFLGVHSLPANVQMRGGLAAKLGDTGFKAMFSVLSLIGFVLIILGYGKIQEHPGKNPILWDPPLFMQHISFLFMLFAMIFLVAAYVPSRIRSALKHPMLVAVKIWAFAHLLSNGDLASMLLFGSFLAWAVFDRISLKRRGNLGPGPTSAPILNDVGVVVLGIALWAFFLLGGHEYLIGVGLISYDYRDLIGA